MAKRLMIQGTSSSVGKSVLTAGLCRLFSNRGLKVAPFKAQNMATPARLNDGGAIAASVVMQAEAARALPRTEMNPLLLEVKGPKQSLVYALGRPLGVLNAREYQAKKEELRPLVRRAFDRLSTDYDLVILEGAGSPAEINLRDGDLVNMAMAHMAEAPVLLVGDIDRGGVFASLVGTLELLDSKDRSRVKGLVINKFRGDRALLESGLSMLETRTGLPVVGVVPYHKSGLPEEDSMEAPAAPLTSAQRDEQYNRLATLLEQSLDMDLIEKLLATQ